MKSRWELECSINYSINVEYLIEKLYFRIFTAWIIAVVLCTYGLAYSNLSPKIYAVALLGLIMLFLLCNFATNSFNAKNQKESYLSLLDGMDSMTDKELNESFYFIQKHDSVPWKAVKRIAENVLHVSLESDPPNDLTIMERFVMFVVQ